MSKLQKTDGGVAVVPGPAGIDAVAAGRMIRVAREASGLHIGALSVAIKVPVSKLEALEDGTLDALSGPVFARALAASVCRALKVDPEEILKALPRSPAAQLQQMGALNQPFRGESGGGRTHVVERLGKRSMIAVAALLAGVAVLFFLPQLRALFPDEKGPSEPAASPLAGASSSTNPAPSFLESLLATPSGSADRLAPVVDTTTQGGAIPLLTKKFISALAFPGEASNSAIKSDLPASRAANGSGLLAFQASAPSWVEVTDANGTVVLRKTLNSGESLQVGGVLPLKVVIGRADVIEVTIRGQRIALQEWSKDNVARFEVK
jgi:cytoskeleton protein RodZ